METRAHKTWKRRIACSRGCTALAESEKIKLYCKLSQRGEGLEGWGDFGWDAPLLRTPG